LCSVNKIVFSRANSCYSESNVATPRPSKRVSSGRFPVRPSISGLDIFGDAKPDSPGIPPPIPTRSHYRVQSQQNSNAARRPVIPPLTIGSSNERNRSQSEGAGSATIRAKRMGIYTRKTADLGAVDELRRNSHFRGFSQGYVLSGGGFGNGTSGPATVGGIGDNGTQRTIANRPLSDLLEHKRRSRAPDVVVEAAKSFLYAMSQLHDTVLNMLRALKRDRLKEGLRKKEDLPRRFAIAYLQIRNLGELLHKFDTLAEEDEEEAQKLSDSIHQACLRSLSHFMFINLSIAENAREIARDGDPRFLRSFLLLQQGSLIELRNACSVLGVDFKDAARPTRKIQDHGRSESTAQIPRPLVVRRFQPPPQQRLAPPYQMPPPVSLNSNESSRTNTLTSISAATPRSGESFATLASSAVSRTNTMQSTFDDPDEEAQFERIYIKLRTACDFSMENIPHIQRHLRKAYELEKREFDSEDPKMKVLANLIEKSDFVYSMAWALTKRLSQIKLKDPIARSQHDFWQQCTTYIKVG
jgi:RAM signalling pathway protein